MLIKLLKLPFKLIALPLIPALMILNLAFALVVGLSSILTNLLSTFFLMGAVAGWITHSAPSMIWQAVGIGVFFMLAPHIACWIAARITDLAVLLMEFVAS